jgi:hypothetical protein
MVAPPAATLSTFRQRLTAHVHAGTDMCPWCEQVIPPDKLEEISGRIAAREREQTLAIAARLEQQHAAENAEAAARAAAELDAVRRQSAEREAAAREEARQTAEAAAAERQAQLEQSQKEALGAVRQQLADEAAARVAAEQAGASLQTQFQRLTQDHKQELTTAKAEAAARENEIREEARRAAQEAAAAQLVTAETARQQAAEALQTATTELEAARTAAAAQALASQARLTELQQATDAVITQVKETAAAGTLRAREEAAAAAATAMHDQLAEKDQAIVAAQAQSAEMQTQLAALTEQQDTVLKQRLDEQREVLEKDKDTAVNAERAQAFEISQKLQNKVNDLQRELEKKSADELGEGAELNLFDELKKQFQDDRIEHVGKGKAGADILHTVMLNGKPCGTIIYDSKNHKQFRSEHIAKLKNDQLAAKADHAILSLHRFPEGTSQLHNRDGVLLANPARVVAAVVLIRQHILQTHKLRLSSAEREEKTARLYAFITSERCAQFFNNVDAYTDGLLEHLVREKKWHDTAMKKRGETYRAIQKTMADLLAEISVIIGTAGPDVAELEEAQS